MLPPLKRQIYGGNDVLQVLFFMVQFCIVAVCVILILQYALPTTLWGHPTA